MTERTPAETVEAVAEFLENDKAMLPDNLSGPEGYRWALYKIRCYALNLRLGAETAKVGARKEPLPEPPPPDDVLGVSSGDGFGWPFAWPKRGRRPNASKGGE